MIDLFTLALTHSLIAIAIIRLVLRPDLDVDGDAPRARRRNGRGRPRA